ncbi:MAG: hypothetical protein IPF70_19030 [Saprospiraceae bacterium]|nr:hypothetical protein [Saprospiraceae bacterium]
MDKDLRTTKYSFINIIMQLYGLQTYSDMKGSIDFTTAKKYYLKLLDSIRSAIGDTILITDKSHKLELLETIKKYKIELKKAVSFDELDQSMITFQTTLIFLLIGSVPNNTHDPKINRKGKWKLNFYRQIHYTQTAEQKKN